MHRTADFWIQHLQLQQHIEGGWYSEVYRSALLLDKEKLPSAFSSERNVCTHIYFLLKKNGFSAFHRIKSDELWHFYAGDPLIIYEIMENGELKEHFLSNDAEKGHSLFCVIKAGNWFGSRVADGGEYGLAGCTVAPGFDFDDFELADRNELIGKYPHHSELIKQMTY
ncbi:MAG: cupin domain-containing protein [Chitinophagaceae bacterium]|nr:cupin domain-containing protein [Chitinophagaceae bacterium]